MRGPLTGLSLGVQNSMWDFAFRSSPAPHFGRQGTRAPAEAGQRVYQRHQMQPGDPFKVSPQAIAFRVEARDYEVPFDNLVIESCLWDDGLRRRRDDGLAAAPGIAAITQPVEIFLI